MTSAPHRFCLRSPPWGWLLALVLAGSGLAPCRAELRLAVLLGSNLRAIEEAAEGIHALSGVQVEEFQLDAGTGEVDQVVATLRKVRFDAVVGLGARAHEFFRSHEFAQPYAATLVLGDGAEAADVVPFEATPAEWAEAVRRYFPQAVRVGALATGEREEARLQGLGAALEAVGVSLVVQPVNGRTPLTVALRQVLETCSVLYFPRDRGLLQAATVLAVLKAAHRARVPVIAFSRSLVKVGAVLSLDLTPEQAGERAARVALRMGSGEIHAQVTFNESRARALGVQVPEELAVEARELGGRE